MKPFEDQMDHRYGDRGGWKGLKQIFSANLPYEMKIENVKTQYRVSRGTAVSWYKQYRAIVGLQ
jgi:hypothetical protein